MAIIPFQLLAPWSGTLCQISSPGLVISADCFRCCSLTTYLFSQYKGIQHSVYQQFLTITMLYKSSYLLTANSVVHYLSNVVIEVIWLCFCRYEKFTRAWDVEHRYGWWAWRHNNTGQLYASLRD